MRDQFGVTPPDQGLGSGAGSGLIAKCCCLDERLDLDCQATGQLPMMILDGFDILGIRSTGCDNDRIQGSSDSDVIGHPIGVPARPGRRSVSRVYYTLLRGKYSRINCGPTTRIWSPPNGAGQPATVPSLDRTGSHPGHPHRPAGPLYGQYPFGAESTTPEHDPRTSGRFGGRQAGRSNPRSSTRSGASSLALQRRARGWLRAGGPGVCRPGLSAGRADRPDQPSTERRFPPGRPRLGPEARPPVPRRCWRVACPGCDWRPRPGSDHTESFQCHVGTPPGDRPA
jgi:hypothetical protein